MDVVKKQSRGRGPDITRPQASQADDVDGKKKYYFNYLTSDKKKSCQNIIYFRFFRVRKYAKTHPPKFEKVEARQIRIVFQGEPGSSDHRTSRPYYIEANTAG